MAGSRGCDLSFRMNMGDGIIHNQTEKMRGEDECLPANQAEAMARAETWKLELMGLLQVMSCQICYSLRCTPRIKMGEEGTGADPWKLVEVNDMER